VTALHRDNPVTRDTVWRVYQLPEELHRAVRQRRQALGQTLREFLVEAVATELPGLLVILREHLPAVAGVARPARLPLTEPLLEALRSAGAEAGLPAARLLLACLGRAARRKRRRGGKIQGGLLGVSKGQCRGGLRASSSSYPPETLAETEGTAEAATAGGEEE